MNEQLFLLQLEKIGQFKLYLSQDGVNDEAALLAKKFKFELILHERTVVDVSGTSLLARHYKFALDEILLKRNHSHLIIVEDDMIVSPDFLEFFESAAFVMKQDPTIWCASSWNDMGVSQYVFDSKRVFRSDYFSGLGWMLTSETWKKLSPIFPKDQWDWWLRGNTVLKNRECIMPEVSRNRNIGEDGVNVHSGDFFQYLQSIAWISRNFTQSRSDRISGRFGDLSYLVHDRYEFLLQKQIDAVFSKLRKPNEFVKHIHDVFAGKSNDSLYLGPFSALDNIVLQTLISYCKTFDSSHATIENFNRAEFLFPPGAAVFLITFEFQQFALLKQYFSLSVYRALHHGMVIMRIQKHVLILADMRKAEYLPAFALILPHKNFSA